MSSATGPDHNEKTKFIHWLNSPNISTGVNQTRIIREILFSPPLFYYFLTKKNKNYQLHNLACSPHLNFKIFQLRPSRRRDYYRGYHIFYCSLYIISDFNHFTLELETDKCSKALKIIGSWKTYLHKKHRIYAYSDVYVRISK